MEGDGILGGCLNWRFCGICFGIRIFCSMACSCIMALNLMRLHCWSNLGMSVVHGKSTRCWSQTAKGSGQTCGGFTVFDMGYARIVSMLALSTQAQSALMASCSLARRPRYAPCRSKAHSTETVVPAPCMPFEAAATAWPGPRATGRAVRHRTIAPTLSPPSRQLASPSHFRHATPVTQSG